MRKVILYGLLFLTTLLDADNPYDNPLTTEYKKLYAEFRSYVMKIIIANLNRKVKLRSQPRKISCLNKCSETRSNILYCHCDDNCELYGDCCYDYWGRCNKNKTVTQSQQDRWKCVSDLHRQHFSQLLWLDFPNNMPRIKGHMMISTCQNNSSPGLENKCLNPHGNTTLGQVPVEGADNVTYRNRYCAFCNGIAKIRNWRYELICARRKNGTQSANEQSKLHNCIMSNPNCTNEDKKYIENYCTSYYAPPANHSKNHTMCSPVEVCPQTPEINVTSSKYRELTLKCEAYMRIVYHEGTYYKNFHCALCHGVDPEKLQNVPGKKGFSTISVFFEIPQPKFKRREKPVYVTRREKPVYVTNTTNTTNTTGQQNNGSDFMEHKTKQLPGEQWLNMVGVAVSMATLILLLIIYSLTKPLRTTPGKIIICLSMSILAYHVILYVSASLSENAVSCGIGAIFLHIAILSSFAWMTVISYDAWKTFGRKANTVTKKKSTFRFYALYSVMSPLVLVATAIAVDHTGVIAVYWRSNGMKSSNTCWIVAPLSHLVFFIIPVGLSLGLNVICLIWTAIGITMVQKETRKLQNCRPTHKDKIKNLQMYIKLSVVMGVTWILGFTIEYSTVVRYLYVILNSFQGFFIFLAFVTNKRVLQKWRDSRKSRSTLMQSSWFNILKSTDISRKPSTG